MSEPEVDNSMETFMTLFNKMFSETKYNLQALNKRMESMDKCFCNVLLLTSDKPFDEENLEENNENQNDENINRDNIQKRKRNTFNEPKNKKNKMTAQDLDEIERMFRNIDEDPVPNTTSPKKENKDFLNKKRKKQVKENKEETNEIKEKNLFKDIKELLKTYSLDKDEEDKNGNKEKEKIKKKRGRKKKKENDEESNGSNGDIDYLVPEKNDGYSKFKEFKELQKKVGNQNYNKSSDEEDYDEIDSDF